MPSPKSSSRRTRRARPPSIIERLRALRGAPRILVFGAILAGILGLFVASGGLVYATNLENNDSFCASCHTQPEAQYYEQSLPQSTQTSAATLAAFHAQKNVRCIDCHSGGGIFGRVNGLSQGAVDALAYYSGNYRHPAITTNKLGDDSCAKCHGEIAANRSFNNHFHRFLAQWQSLDPNAAHCVDCHTAHPTGDASQGYLNAATVQAQCQACHNAVGER
jgi:hypothetical protein